MKIPVIVPFILVILITIGCQADSSETDFPKGCSNQGISYQENNIVLNMRTESKQTLYLFNNISDKSFWLNHPVGKDPGASAGWASEIDAGSWSALTLGKSNENFALNCSIIGDGGVKYLSCKDVVKSCVVENVKFNSDNSGGYWVAENMHLQSLIETIKGRGISW